MRKLLVLFILLLGIPVFANNPNTSIANFNNVVTRAESQFSQGKFYDTFYTLAYGFDMTDYYFGYSEDLNNVIDLKRQKIISMYIKSILQIDIQATEYSNLDAMRVELNYDLDTAASTKATVYKSLKWLNRENKQELAHYIYDKIKNTKFTNNRKMNYVFFDIAMITKYLASDRISETLCKYAQDIILEQSNDKDFLILVRDTTYEAYEQEKDN